MDLSILIIILFFIYILLDIYKLRYHTETYFITTNIHQDYFEIQRASVLQKQPRVQIKWSDVTSVFKIVGHDSSRWWYQMVQKKIGFGVYLRLVVTTDTNTYVFHPISQKGLVNSKFIEKFDASSQLEEEFKKRSIHIEEKDVNLLNVLRGKDDWYANQ